MDRAVLKSGLVAAVLGFVAACALYNPTIPDCSVTCGVDGACPAGMRCADGFCRPAGATVACECRPGTVRECGGDAGECTPGVQRCGDDGRWLPACVGEGRPAQETCDNRDNDCNGAVDDGVVDLQACALTQGVCASARRTCDAGAQPACTPASYGPQYEAAEQACDGVDNDCDGWADMAAPIALATDVAYPEWRVLGYDGGLALVYRRFNQGAEVVVTRFDERLQPVGARQVAKRSEAFDLESGADDRTVVAAWVEDGGVVAARFDEDGGIVQYEEARGAAPTSWLRVGVGPGGSAVAVWFAELETVARMARFTSAGTLVDVTDLNREADGGLATTVLYGLTVSTRGQFALYSGDVATDAGAVTQRPIIRTSDLARVGLADYFGGVYATVFERDAGLSSVYPYSDDTSTPPLSGVWLVPELVSRVPEVSVVSATDATTWGGADAVRLPTDELAIVVANNAAARAVLVRASGPINSPTFTRRTLDAGPGDTDPRVAATGTPGTVVVAWKDGTTVYAARVCLP